MKYTYNIITFVLIFLANICYAQKVTNITAEQVGQTIQVSYNLETESPCAISLFYSTDNGSTWQGPLKKVDGDVGDKVVNGAKKINWDVLNELDQLRFSSVIFKVDAINYFEENSQTVPNPSEMNFEALEFNFGTIKQGESVTHEFTFTNNGKEDLIITNVQGSCGCLVPYYPNEAIKKGTKGFIKVIFNSAGKSGLQDKTLRITSNAKNSPVILHLRGAVEPTH